MFFFTKNIFQWSLSYIIIIIIYLFRGARSFSSLRHLRKLEAHLIGFFLIKLGGLYLGLGVLCHCPADRRT